MSVLSDQIMEDIKLAMRERNTLRTTVLRGVRSAFQNALIEKRGKGELSESEEIAILRKQIKQRQDSAESYREARREDLVEIEEKEISILEAYLPQPLDEEEVENIILAAIAETGASGQADMGKVMGVAKGKCAGRVDGATLSEAVRRLLK